MGPPIVCFMAVQFPSNMVSTENIDLISCGGVSLSCSLVGLRVGGAGEASHKLHGGVV